MAFNKELEDFAAAFSSGYQMTRSRDEREADRLKNQALAGEVEQQQHAVELRPELEQQAREEFATNQAVKKSQIDNLTQEIIAKRRANSDEEVARARRDAESLIRFRGAQTEGQDITNQKSRFELSHADEAFAVDLAGKKADTEGKQVITANQKLELEFNQKIKEMLGDNPGSQPSEFAPHEVTPNQQAVPVGTTPSATLDVSQGPGNNGQWMDMFKGPYNNTVKAAGREAVKTGIASLQQAHGLDKDQAVGTPETGQDYAGYLTGARAGDPDTVEMVEGTMDELAGGGLSQNEKVFNAMSYGYRYYTALGQPDKAKAFAESMVAHYQTVVGQYTGVIQAAAQQGHMDQVAELAVRAYANIPTGDELAITKTKDGKHYQVTFKDMDGKTIEKTLMTPQEMGAIAMQITPASFVDIIAAAAGRDKNVSSAAAAAISKELGVDVTGWTTEEINAYRQTKSANSRAKAGGSSGLKVSPVSAADMDEAQTTVSTEFDSFAAEHPSRADFLNDPVVKESLVPVAADIFMRNTDKTVSSQDALRITLSLIDSGLKAPEEVDENTWLIKVPGHPPVKMDKGRADMLLAIRQQKLGQESLSASEAKDRAEKDAKDRTDTKAVQEKIRRRAFGPGGELKRNDYGIGPGLVQ